MKDKSTLWIIIVIWGVLGLFDAWDVINALIWKQAVAPMQIFVLVAAICTIASCFGGAIRYVMALFWFAVAVLGTLTAMGVIHPVLWITESALALLFAGWMSFFLILIPEIIKS